MLTGLSASFKTIKTSLALWWHDWLVLTVLNLAWVLCLATLVLGPPATFALYRAAQMVVNGQGVDFPELLRFSRRHLLKSWLWMLANLLIAAGIWLNLQFYAGVNVAWTVWVRPIPLLIGALWLTLQVYALPYLMEQEVFSLRQAFRNALFTLLASPLYSVVVISFVCFSLVLGTRLVFLFFLGLPCLLAVLGTVAVKERLETLGVRGRDG